LNTLCEGFRSSSFRYEKGCTFQRLTRGFTPRAPDDLRGASPLELPTKGVILTGDSPPSRLPLMESPLHFPQRSFHSLRCACSGVRFAYSSLFFNVRNLPPLLNVSLLLYSHRTTCSGFATQCLNQVPRANLYFAILRVSNIYAQR